jgi:hypothetical protein
LIPIGYPFCLSRAFALGQRAGEKDYGIDGGRRSTCGVATSIFDAELGSGKDVGRLGHSQANAACEVTFNHSSGAAIGPVGMGRMARADRG